MPRTTATKPNDLDLEAFDAICRQLGLELADNDLATMREGYLGLRRMIETLPSINDPWLEPAFAVTPGCGQGALTR